MTALFVISTNWKPQMFMDRQYNGYYSAIKSKKVLTQKTTWMILKIIMLNERQTRVLNERQTRI